MLKFHVKIIKMKESIASKFTKYIPASVRIILGSGVICMGAYFVLYPLYPWVKYELFDKHSLYFPYESRLTDEDGLPESGRNIIEENNTIPKDNRLVIPSIGVDMPILGGDDSSVLDIAVWHRPGSVNPGIEGNVVLTAHRLAYGYLPEEIRASTSFYHLDKLDEGDVVIVYWEGVEYDYKVSGNEIVSPREVAVESQTEFAQLTLYTCDPIGSNKERLVVYAALF